MKLNKLRTAAVAATLAVLSVVPVFANGPAKGKAHPRPHREFRQMHHDITAKKLIMGTVASVDETNNVITLTDADGKSRKIHVNPMTVIFKFPQKSICHPAPQAAKNAKKPVQAQGQRPHFKPLEIKDLKTGNWVTVRKFRTDTETAEAQSITIITPRPAETVIDTTNAK